MCAVYYNEFDPYAAQWLRNLISAGHIAAGDVDERSITEVTPDDVKGYTQSHFFAGIGGWSLALRLADWPDDRPVWTGSCPCQPFSTAGKAGAQSDERHLWPDWYRLIRKCRPATVFGEQAASATAFGWLDEVFNDLEAETYACAAAILPACSVDSPHKRDRLWFVANAARSERAGDMEQPKAGGGQGFTDGRSILVGKPQRSRLERHAGDEKNERRSIPNGSASSADSGIEWIECPDGKIRPVKSGIRLLAYGVSARVGKLRAYGNAIVPQVAAEFIKATKGLIP